MPDPHVATQRRIGAPAEQIYRLIADFRAHHPGHHGLLPDSYRWQVSWLHVLE
jgi:hypothetical protein